MLALLPFAIEPGTKNVASIPYVFLYSIHLSKSFEIQSSIVIENAPLGIQSGKAAGLTVYAVNTGILTREDLAQADCVFDSMAELLEKLKAMD